jgi:hypothetical protein
MNIFTGGLDLVLVLSTMTADGALHSKTAGSDERDEARGEMDGDKGGGGGGGVVVVEVNSEDVVVWMKSCSSSPLLAVLAASELDIASTAGASDTTLAARDTPSPSELAIADTGCIRIVVAGSGMGSMRVSRDSARGAAEVAAISTYAIGAITLSGT